MARGKVFASLIALPVLGYSAVCGWMYAKQRELMYFPEVTRVDATQTNFQIAADGITLKGWLLNEGQPGAVIYYGGNAESIEKMRAGFSRWFPRSSVYLLSYRGFGANEGEPSQAALFADALAIYDQVRVRQPDAPIVVIGRSLGSGVASYVASRRSLAGLVLVTPFDSMVAVAQAHYRWLPVGRLLQDRYESTRYVARYTGPALVVRAGRDEVIPAANTERLIDAFPAPPRVLALPESGHDNVASDPAYGRALAEFVAAAGNRSLSGQAGSGSAARPIPARN